MKNLGCLSRIACGAARHALIFFLVFCCLIQPLSAETECDCSAPEDYGVECITACALQDAQNEGVDTLFGEGFSNFISTISGFFTGIVSSLKSVFFVISQLLKWTIAAILFAAGSAIAILFLMELLFLVICFYNRNGFEGFLFFAQIHIQTFVFVLDNLIKVIKYVPGAHYIWG